MGDFNAIKGNQAQDGDTRVSHRVDGDTGAGPGNDLVWEATVIGGGVRGGKWGAWQLGRPEGGKLKGQGWEPTSRPRPQVHAAEFCQHEAETRAEPEQRSGQGIISAGRTRARGWMGGRGVKGVSSHLTAPLASTSRQLYSASLLLLAPNVGKPRRVRESLWRDWGRGLAPSEGLVQRRAPAPTPVPPSPPPPDPPPPSPSS